MGWIKNRGRLSDEPIMSTGRKIAIQFPHGCPEPKRNAVANAVRQAMEVAAREQGIDPEEMSIYATWLPVGWRRWGGKIHLRSPGAT
jgi:hypothetical protein